MISAMLRDNDKCNMAINAYISCVNRHDDYAMCIDLMEKMLQCSTEKKLQASRKVDRGTVGPFNKTQEGETHARG